MAWYAVYTKPRWEKKVVKLLTQNNIINYCPMRTEISQWTDRKKKVEKPVLPSYVFVKINLRREVEQVRKIEGILNFVYWLKEPAKIRDQEMNDLIDFLAKYEHTHIYIEKLNMKEGGEVKIEYGIFTGRSAIIKKIKNKTIELELIGWGIKLIVNKN